jgi:hypothetical protein
MCEVCDNPATHTLSGIWATSVAGPIHYCVEHATAMAVDLLAHGDEDAGDGPLLGFAFNCIGTETDAELTDEQVTERMRELDERTDEEVGWDQPPAG